MGYKVVPANKKINKKWLRKGGIEPKQWTQEEKEKLAAKMRFFPTEAEERLRKYLMGGIMGYEFDFQPVVHGFIPDFYQPELQICIEVDGGIHKVKYKEDQKRTRILNSYGVVVLRFKNSTVMNDIDAVIKRIKRTIEMIEKSRKTIQNQA